MSRKDIEVIAEDQWLVAANKPAGLVTAHGQEDEPTLIDVLRQDSGRFDGLRLVHRLDRETSGVCLLARTYEAQRHLARQFQDRTVEKLYLALVAGYVADESGEIEAPIGPRPGNRRLMRVDRKHGKPAHTLWRLLARYRGAALLLCRPLSGRTHQIRVHLESVGHPLLVDPAYGGGPSLLLSSFKKDYRPKADRDERPLIARVSLHAMQLDLRHPAKDEPLRLQAPPPKDFRAAINQLNHHAATGVPFDPHSFPQWSK